MHLSVDREPAGPVGAELGIVATVHYDGVENTFLAARLVRALPAEVEAPAHLVGMILQGAVRHQLIEQDYRAD